MKIFIIEQGWCDPLENRDDFGYAVVGYVYEEEEAKQIVTQGGFFRGDETWSLRMNYRDGKKIPRYRYKELPYWGKEKAIK